MEVVRVVVVGRRGGRRKADEDVLWRDGIVY